MIVFFRNKGSFEGEKFNKSKNYYWVVNAIISLCFERKSIKILVFL